MHKEHKRINDKNFPIFKKLIEEVFLKATGKPVEKVSEKICNDITDIIKEKTSTAIPGGKSLENYINTILYNDYNKQKVNPEYPTLNNLAKYVTEDFDNLSVQDKKNNENSKTKSNNAYWIKFEKKYACLFLHNQPDINSALEESSSAKEIDEGPATQIEPTEMLQKNYEKLPILQAEIKPIDFTNSQKPFHYTIDEKAFLQAGFLGGACAGFLGVIIITAISYVNGTNQSIVEPGYRSISFEEFMNKIFALLLLFQMLAGALLGWLACHAALAKKSFLNRVKLFIISFIIIVLFRQFMARDAWILPHILGEPDFETIATGLMASIAFFILVQTFRGIKFKRPTVKDVFKIILKITMYSIVTWCSVYFIYHLLTDTFGVIHYRDSFISTAVFTVDFPHPDRPVIAALLCIIYTFCIIAFIRSYAYTEESITEN
jgi:hypothetical protein